MAQSTVKGSLLLAILAVILCLETEPIDARTDPTTGKIRLLYIGDPWSFQQNRIVLDWIHVEPRFEITVVPADLEVMMLSESIRFTRLYLPRNYASLNSSYDVLIPNNISPRLIETRIIESFRQGVEVDAIGAYFVGFDYWGGTNDIGFWKALSFYNVLPAEIDTETYQYPSDGKIFWEVLVREPLFAVPAGLEGVVMFVNRGGDILPKQGTLIHAVWRQRRTPSLVTGGYGHGITLQLDQAWNDFSVDSMREFRYFPDLVYNHIYFVAGMDPPGDVELAHRTRELLIDVGTRRIVTLSFLDFVEIFGGNVDGIEDDLRGMDDQRREAERDYIMGDYEGASETLKGILDQYGVVEGRLAKIKAEALFWTHISEWLVVASTCMMCGAVIWTLMVRRRLYREAGLSRFSSLK